MKRFLVIPGDPAGVGPELLESVVRDGEVPADDFALGGPAWWLRRWEGREWELFFPNDDPVMEKKVVPGAAGPVSAKQAIGVLESAARACREGRYAGLVTGPICKETVVREGFPFAGQTEFLADTWGGEPSMAFWGEELRVVLATWHIPLAQVPAALNPGVLERAVERAFVLGRKSGRKEPRVAVCGLNPHAGEKGILGTEEEEWINPCLQEWAQRFPGLVPTAQPSDTVFWNARQGLFDVVVALYHDQGLGPLKTCEFHTSCQVTLGLPYPRTSPDHGTAFALAGKGQAHGGSFRQALRKMRCFKNL